MGATPELAATVAFLRTPAAYGADEVVAVDCIETHLSWVFLVDARVYKLKKPLRLPFLDFTTLARRHQSCAQELRLGRRLAPDVYLGLVPVVRGARGLALGGRPTDQIIDWLVVMRRLAADRMLPAMLARGAATLADAEAVGAVLAGFYRTTPRAPWDGPGYRARLRALTVAMSGELIARGAPRAQIAPLAHAQLTLLERAAPELDARIAAGRVVDAHGDLRPEHICLEHPPVIIDPLEFDDELRQLDVGSELAYLLLECERLGARWFGERVLAHHAALSGDRLPAALGVLYRRHHALTRALIAVRHLDDVAVAQAPRWRAKAADYLARAWPEAPGSAPVPPSP